jgi:hypothetical protein
VSANIHTGGFIGFQPDFAAGVFGVGPSGLSLTPTAIDATGGTKTTETIDGVSYNIHTFTASGTFTPDGPMAVEYLVVAGGGGSCMGGGGAGGYLTGTSFLSPMRPPSWLAVAAPLALN